MKNHPNFYIKSILPNLPQLEAMQPKPMTTEPKEEIKLNTKIDAGNKTVMVVLDSTSAHNDCESIMTEQSFHLLEKIMLSMKISSEQIHYLKNWDLNLTQESLVTTLSQSKVKIVFLIGSIASQHFLGKDKKISQIQGQVFDYSYQDRTFHFICLYHPDFIALNASIKAITWSSIKNLIPWIEQQLCLD